MGNPGRGTLTVTLSPVVIPYLSVKLLHVTRGNPRYPQVSWFAASGGSDRNRVARSRLTSQQACIRHRGNRLSAQVCQPARPAPATLRALHSGAPPVIEPSAGARHGVVPDRDHIAPPLSAAATLNISQKRSLLDTRSPGLGGSDYGCTSGNLPEASSYKPASIARPPVRARSRLTADSRGTGPSNCTPRTPIAGIRERVAVTHCGSASLGRHRHPTVRRAARSTRRGFQSGQANPTAAI
jgi:hypothetical protein